MSKIKNAGLTLALLAMFAASMAGQIFSGQKVYNDEATGDFWEATFENWESEFLQMGVFVLLTVWLYQKGSSESKDPDEKHESEEDPRWHQRDKDAPWPVKKGGAILKLYEHSLSMALFLLFGAAFVGHLFGGWRKEVAVELAHGQPAVTLAEYLGSAQFWFESMQNWQSEFLAVLTIVLLSIFLRERGSPQSKPVAASHAETGGG